MHLNILLCSNDENKRKQNYNWKPKENKKLNSKCGIPHHHHFTAHKQRPFYVIFTLIFYSKVLLFLGEFFFASWALRSKMRENGMQHKSKWMNERSCACAKKNKNKMKNEPQKCIFTDKHCQCNNFVISCIQVWLFVPKIMQFHTIEWWKRWDALRFVVLLGCVIVSDTIISMHLNTTTKRSMWCTLHRWCRLCWCVSPLRAANV